MLFIFEGNNTAQLNCCVRYNNTMSNAIHSELVVQVNGIHYKKPLTTISSQRVGVGDINFDMSLFGSVWSDINDAKM